MAEVLLFHHACGRTAGILDFARTLERAGHAVHVPDLYDGHVFDDLAAGLAYAQELGFGTIVDGGVGAAEALPAELVYAGFSLGVLPAQKLAQTRAGARGALLFHSCLPPAQFGGQWPDGVPVQIHAMDNDELFVTEGDLEAARELVATTSDAGLFLYPGDRHLFADSSLDSYDAAATDLLTERVLSFLDRSEDHRPDQER